MTTPTMPTTTSQPVQRDLALLKANRIRIANARRSHFHGLDRHTARHALHHALLNPTETQAALSVERLLLACPGIGHRKAEALLVTAGITLGTMRLRDLDDERRERLAEAVLLPVTQLLSPARVDGVERERARRERRLREERDALAGQVEVLRGVCARLREGARS